MQEFLAQDLMHAHPPMIGDRNKRTGFGTSAPRTSVFSNTGRGMPYPCTEAPGLTCKGIQQCVGTAWFFDYVRSELLPRAVEWHVNFADLILFGAYGTAFFAQDEIQVAGHPSLVALEEALAARDRPVLTVEDGSPTPVLVAGVEHSRSGGN